jgi:hypothetical protein
MFLNCSCLDAEMDGSRIVSVTGWQLTTYTYHTIKARMFADCSGDGVLAPLTNAQFRVGREARSEFNELIEPEVADNKTMGMTCLFQARDAGHPVTFEPLPWAHSFPADSDLPKDFHGYPVMGFWWVELGGEHDSIHDTETLRDELLRITYGIWDHIKNRGQHSAANWELDWVQFLPGKRESRRYIGDHVLNQNDVESQGKFDDLVAYGGWSMDDHDTAGFWAFKKEKPSTIFHKAPSPYGIPFRSLYSKNIDNLFFAGRCASASHAAMSSTRVMGTGCSMGQAVGTAAVMAVRLDFSPRSVGQQHIRQLQQSLLWQDCYLPWVKQEFSPLTTGARLIASHGDPEPVRDGINRPVGTDLHAWEGKPGDYLEYSWEQPVTIATVTLIVNSALDKNIAMSYHQKDDQLTAVPEEMVKDIRIEINTGLGWQVFKKIAGNYQRLVRLEIDQQAIGIRVVFESTWGAETVRIYAFYVEQSTLS